MLMKKKIVLFLFLIAFAKPFFAQESGFASCHDCYGYYYTVVNDFLIVATKKNYEEAEKIAKECAQKLDVDIYFKKDSADLDSRRGIAGVNPDTKEDGIYISVEYTNDYINLTSNYYCVVLGSGPPGDSELKDWLEKAKKIYPDSYIKTTILYGDGCGE